MNSSQNGKLFPEFDELYSLILTEITGLSETIDEIFITVRNEDEKFINLYTIWKNKIIKRHSIM